MGVPFSVAPTALYNFCGNFCSLFVSVPQYGLNNSTEFHPELEFHRVPTFPPTTRTFSGFLIVLVILVQEVTVVKEVLVGAQPVPDWTRNNTIRKLMSILMDIL